MPHNLYLHSAPVQTGAVDNGEAARKKCDFLGRWYAEPGDPVAEIAFRDAAADVFVV